VGGRPICVDGVVIGSGGTLLTTARGERAARAVRVDCAVIDLEASAFYQPDALTGHLTGRAAGQ
jgi:hypothetical protein